MLAIAAIVPRHAGAATPGSGTARMGIRAVPSERGAPTTGSFPSPGGFTAECCEDVNDDRLRADVPLDPPVRFRETADRAGDGLQEDLPLQREQPAVGARRHRGGPGH